MKKTTVRAVCVSAIMGAIGFILMLLEFPMAFVIPSFIKMDFSELPALITSFAFGPLYGICVCAIKNLLHLTVTSSAGIGELSNFLLGAVFTGTAGWIYRKHRTRRGALAGAAIGAALMAVCSMATNYFLIYPFYTAFMPMPAIIGMYRAILPAANSLLKCLLIFNLPFTLVKGLLDAALCFAVYKKLSPVLKSGKNNG